jgi:branched-subunit amino acid ABC-type transport system permease component
MVKTFSALALLFIATLWLPIWVQVILYVLAVMFVPQRILLLLPAVFADAYYAPTASFSLYTLQTTLFVFALLCAHYIIINKTRIGLLYGMEEK